MAGCFLEGLSSLTRLSHRPLAREEIDTGALVRGVANELLPDPAMRRVELVIGPLPACRADAEMLRHVYLNVLSNALKFTRTGDQARTTVGATDEGGETVYSVTDNGIGFPSEDAGQLFDDFARLHDEREYEGTGIGLALVRRIVERHGGCVRTEGEVDRGMTVPFTLGP
jgi:signal transduction histidine kinase